MQRGENPTYLFIGRICTKDESTRFTKKLIKGIDDLVFCYAKDVKSEILQRLSLSRTTDGNPPLFILDGFPVICHNLSHNYKKLQDHDFNYKNLVWYVCQEYIGQYWRFYDVNIQYDYTQWCKQFDERYKLILEHQ